MEMQTKIALERQNPWWFGRDYDTGIPRLDYYPILEKYISAQEILIVLGARRTGKSTLLYQMIYSLKVKPESILYLNFDEPIFQIKADDPAFLGNLIEEYLISHKGMERLYVFIDEVQNYNYWVQTVKTFHDVNKRVKFVLTGSTAVLQRDTITTRLSGRFFSATIFPLTFREYKDFTGLKGISTVQKIHALDRYLQYGGFPRVVIENDVELKQDVLKNYFQTIYLKDIIYPHNVRNNKDVFELLYFVLSNIGAPFSYSNIANTLNISADTVKEYMSYAEQSYLIYMIPKYDHSVRKQLANPRKAYCIDTGLINSVSFRFSENLGRLIENLVFVTLAEKQKEVFYHKDKHECDFLVKDGKKIVMAIQVTVSLKDENVKKRELKGLMEAINAHSLDEGYIVTESESGMLDAEGKNIHIVPLYEWAEMDFDKERKVGMMRKGFNLGKKKFKSRDDLYDRK